MYHFLNLDFKLFKRVIKWYVSYYILKKPLPLIVNLIITSKCDFDCKFCFLGPEAAKTSLSFDAYIKIIDDLQTLGTYLIYITGGEPLVLNDIAQRITYAKSKIPRVHMVTNGYLLDQKMAFKLNAARIDSVAVSIDALENKHDKFRNKNGAFAHAMEALINLKKYAPKIKTFVKTQIAPWNIDDLPELTMILRKMGVQQVFDPTTYFPALQEKASQEELVIASDYQIKKIDEFVKFIYRSCRTPIKQASLKHIKNHYLSIRDKNSNKLNKTLFKGKCTVPYFHVQIGPDGLITPCGALLDQVQKFSVFSNTLRGIIMSAEYQNTIHSLGQCRKCLETLQYCFLTPRMCFPVGNFIKNTFSKYTD